MTLERLTWDQATIVRAATARGFTILGIAPGTIRRWAHEGRIHAIGKAPGGAHLYQIAEVSVVAERMKSHAERRGA